MEGPRNRRDFNLKWFLREILTTKQQQHPDPRSSRSLFNWVPEGSLVGFLLGRKSVILGVWAAPGARESLQKCGGRRFFHLFYPFSYFFSFSSFFHSFQFLHILLRFFHRFLAFSRFQTHVEVGSSSKEPAFDLFARVGRSGLRDRVFLGPERGPPLNVAKKS